MKNKNFLKFYLAKLISQIGDSMFLFVVTWHVLDTTNSAILSSVLAASSAIPIIAFTPIAGIVADKVNRKYLLVVTDLIRAIFLILLLLTMRIESIYIYTFFIAVFLLNVITAFYLPGSSALIPNIVKDDKLTKANSFISISTNLALVAGFIVGGALYTKMSIESVFLINAISFIISAILTSQLNLVHRIKEIKKKRFWSDMKEGFDYLIQQKTLFTLFIFFIFVNFVLSPLSPVYLPYIFNQLLNMPPIYLSYTQLSYAIGYVVMASIFSKINTKKDFIRYIIRGLKVECCAVFVISIILTFFSNHYTTELLTFTLLLLVVGVLGTGVVIVNLHVEVYFQKNVDDDFRGRVSSFLVTLAKLSMPFGYLIGGVLLKLMKLHYVLFITTVIFMVIIYKMIKNKNLNEYIKITPIISKE